jgi:hypothetical protein
MLAYCHIANITLAPPRSQNTISSAIGTMRTLRIASLRPTTRSNHDQSMAMGAAGGSGE